MSRFRSQLDAIKVFGITSYLAQTELNELEARLTVNLRRKRRLETRQGRHLLPQFEESVRREAAEMAKHYEIFCRLGKSIRKLVSGTLESNKGATWWKSGRTPQNVEREMAERTQREIDSGVTPRSEEPIDYTTFGELGEIIKANWDLFGGVFSSKKAVEKVMSSLNTLPGLICPL